MKIQTIIAALLLCTLGIAGALGYDDSSRDKLGHFDSVSIHITAETLLVKGEKTSLDIEMSDRIARNLDIYTERGTLVIKKRGPVRIKKGDVKIRITMPAWENLTLSGSGILRSGEYWNNDFVHIKSTGSADLELQSITARNAEISVSGSGFVSIDNIDVRGDYEADLTGSGDIRVNHSNSALTNIRLSGSGRYNGQVETDELTAKLTGSGDIILAGRSSKATLKSTGSGKISGNDLLTDEAYVVITGSGDISLQEGSHLKEIRMTGSGTFQHY